MWPGLKVQPHVKRIGKHPQKTGIWTCLTLSNVRRFALKNKKTMLEVGKISEVANSVGAILLNELFQVDLPTRANSWIF